MTLPKIEDFVVEKILELRGGLDGQMGTTDDGFQNVGDVIARTGMDASLQDKITTTERKFLRVVCFGQVNNVKAGVWVIAQQQNKKFLPVFWREELMQ